MKYCIRLKNAEDRKNFLFVVGDNDPDFELDPEDNPVTVWITTSLSKDFLQNLDTVEDVMEVE